MYWRRLGGLLLALILFAAPCASCGGSGNGDGSSRGSGPIRIGVMLPLTGRDAVGYKAPLEWARDNVNAAGGIGGRRLELVYGDIGRRPLGAVVRRLVGDDSIAAVIGPDNSEDARKVVSTFFNKHKLIVTPSATAADLFRAFSGKQPRYFWRPVESDIAQVRTLLTMAAGGGATSVGLVTGSNEYGDTFYNWFGFLAAELGLQVRALVPYDQSSQSCERPIDQALGAAPDALIAVPDDAQQAICMANESRARGGGTRLLFPDSGQDPSLIQALGPRAEGLEGTGLAPDPSNGFAEAYTARFGEGPPPYAANAYDAVLLLAYGLDRSGGHAGRELADAISAVVAGTGPAVGWDAPGVAAALAAIQAGQAPAVSGAVGPWNFDKDSGIELVSSTYEHWVIAGGRFTVAQYLPTGETPTALQGVAAFNTPPSPGREQAAVGGGYEPGPKTGTWALLVAASDGWENYRHQADVLAQYQRLRAGGVPDDHIVVVSANDVANDKRNPNPGVVRYQVGGPNLNENVRVDYPLHGMTADRLMAILSGHESADTPKVIRSGPGDNVYVYLAGHGNQNGLYVGLGDCLAKDKYSILSPQALDDTIATMAAERRYRRMLVVADSCESGALGQNLNAPGALLISASSPVENSLSTNYDSKLETFLADEFSFQLANEEARAPSTSLDELYKHLYLNVRGSHVAAYGPAFGNTAGVSLGEFITR